MCPGKTICFSSVLLCILGTSKVLSEDSHDRLDARSGTYNFVSQEVDHDSRPFQTGIGGPVEYLTTAFAFSASGVTEYASVRLQTGSGLSMTASATTSLSPFASYDAPGFAQWKAASLVSERLAQTSMRWRKNRTDLLHDPLEYQLAVLSSSIRDGSLSLDTNLSCVQQQGNEVLNAGHSFELEALLGCATTPMTRWGLYAAGLRNVEDTLSYGASLGKRTYFTAGPSFSYTTPSWATNIRLLKDFVGENYPQAWQVSLRVNWAF